ncbi:hypothetical protein ZYGR_0AD06270 [Zygosaccharomyces rouxii]|uniref:ZYRO0G20504p n=2 Tax=Zygosaccharomyces rouxii TaxID=4956 RepID=C5E1F2_ZYGRC|nr:uncharacterized protein ZYRO0G20504g [Zygosaccharomyces rouxii]KAH9202927.1 NADP-dependent oxidoreductase domain-containing protein [Zygosaccharomyces rouxii]GAV51444.1 hypothetical protein ZYGR_0AD06270 [Zygosaccharomyces rouxii]CAR29936.1 ZYRO0G20504p [Zygosaccharomyces rouxii]
MADSHSLQFPVKQVNFGNTSLSISPIVVNCKLIEVKTVDSFQEKDKDELLPMLKYCYDTGLRTFDANEDNGVLLGEFLQNYEIDRKDVVIISKMDIPAPYDLEFLEAKEAKLTEQEGYLRNYIFKSVKELLNGVGTYIDILQIASFDADLPKAELLNALNELVDRSEVLYTSAPPMNISQFTEWQQIADLHHWTKFVSWQLDYNLLHTPEEKQKIEFSKSQGLGLLSWVPSDGGLGGKIVKSIGEPACPQRLSGLMDLKNINTRQQEAYHSLQALSDRKKRPRAAIVAARALSIGCYPIVGCSSVKDVNQAIMAIATHLTPEEFKILELHLD